jgi:hypothetical protein
MATIEVLDASQAVDELEAVSGLSLRQSSRALGLGPDQRRCRSFWQNEPIATKWVPKKWGLRAEANGLGLLRPQGYRDAGEGIPHGSHR